MIIPQKLFRKSQTFFGRDFQVDPDFAMRGLNLSK